MSTLHRILALLVLTAISLPAQAFAGESCRIYRFYINIHTTRDEVYWSITGPSTRTREVVEAAAERTYGYGKYDSLVEISTQGATESGCSTNNGGYSVTRDFGVVQ